MTNTYKENLKNRYFLHISLLILLTSFAVRFIYVGTVIVDNPIRADAEKYMSIATNLVTHGIYSHVKSDNPVPNGFITPGYPSLLALIKIVTNNPYSEYKTILYLQATLSALSAFLFFRIALRLFPLWGAALSGLIISFSPHQIVFSGYVLTETLFTFLLCSGMYLLLSSLRNPSIQRFIGIGIIIGLAALVRPAVILLPLFLCLIMWHFQSGKRIGTAITAMLIGVCLMWIPWATWQSTYGSKTKGTSLAAASFAYGSYPNLLYDDAKTNYTDKRMRQAVSYKEDPAYREMSASLSAGLRITAQRAMEEPWTYLKWYLLGKPVMFWSWDNPMSLQGGPFVYPVLHSVYHKTFWAKASFSALRFLHPFLTILAIIGAIIVIKNIFFRKETTPDNYSLLFLFSVPIYYTIVHIFLLPIPRYAVPIHGFVYIGGIFTFLLSVNGIFYYILSTKRGSHYWQKVYDKFREQ